MKKLFVILFSLSTVLAYAQTNSIKRSLPLSQGSPESVGMSSERLSRIDSMCIKAVSGNKIPGIVALVARKGKIVYHKAFGMADNQAGRSLKRDDIFRIASQTKAITATAVMMLWEEGKFKLDDPVSKYIPEFSNMQVLKSFNAKDTSYTTEPAKGKITIRQLLTHTSGLGYGEIDDDPRFKMIYQKAGITDAFSIKNITIEENVKKLAKLPLHFNPGEKYSYSEGLDVLGYFIEVISGMPFDVFLKKHLFDPLGMLDTWFYLPQGSASRLVPVQYKSGDGQWSRYPVTWYDPDYPVKGERRFFSGGGGLSSTAVDYALFIQMYLNGGELNGRRFLSRSTVQLIMSNQIGSLWGEDPDNYYGLAFAVTTQKGQEKGDQGNMGSFGWGGYFNTQYFGDPKEQIIGILMKQIQGTAGDSDWKFRILVNQAVDD